MPYQPNLCVHAGLFHAGQEEVLSLQDSSQEREHLDVPCQTGLPTGLQRPVFWPAECQRFSWHFSSASAIHREVLPVVLQHDAQGEPEFRALFQNIKTSLITTIALLCIAFSVFYDDITTHIELASLKAVLF